MVGTVNRLERPTLNKLVPPAHGIALLGRDLRPVMGEGPLIQAVLNAIQAEGGSGEPEATAGWSAAGVPPVAMLALLTYSYASGIYESAEIEFAARQDPILRYLCAKQFPSAALLRRFRRRQRVTIEACLRRVLARVWSEATFNPRGGRPWTVSSLERSRNRWQGPCNLSAAGEEAAARLDEAVRIDAFALDD